MIIETALPDFHIRHADKGDAGLILDFIRQLAEYEKLAHEVVATEDTLREALFGDSPYAQVIIAEFGDTPVGYALYFHNFSTFTGRPGIYLEDLFVTPAYRGRGFGKCLLAYIAKLAVEKNCTRVEWSVLDWNEPSIQFYRSIGAVPMDEWTAQRLHGEALVAFARQFQEESQ
ncbi:MAG: GNAT family N-acetyltransferase [Pseudohongiellaceae bacterium]